MKSLIVLLLAAAPLLSAPNPRGGAVDEGRARVTRDAVKGVDTQFDRKLQSLWPDSPVSILGPTQGAYLPGYGVVFMAEVDLAPTAGISPFHQKITPDEAVRTHKKKIERLSALKDTMTQMLIESAGMLEGIPDTEQITLAVSLFFWTGEDTASLPMQLVVHATRGALRAGKAAAASAIKMEQF
ncbi:MAG TPA: hypothetical protein VKU01_17305 [Bryobacteraceae bacterium]|nr:hypothetical protein [Bryobacteraceae bacterium]